jgi:hypothetical protein
MSQKMNLKEVERKAFTSTFQDGLWDLFLGLQLLAWGLALLLEEIVPLSDWWVAVLAAPLMLVYLTIFAAKKYITAPRIGRVKFGSKRKARVKGVVAMTFVILLLGLFVGALWWGGIKAGLPEWVAGIPLPPVIWMVLFITGFSLAAYFLDFSRLYLYGVLYAISLPTRIILKQNPDLGSVSLIVYFVSGSVMVLIGAVLFIRFLRKYPLPAVAASDGNS